MSAMRPRTAKWRNWAQNVECRPVRDIAPATIDALRSALRKARDEGRTVRPRGSGHSFVPLCATEDVAIAPAAMKGIVEIDFANSLATFRSGTLISELGEPLNRAGLALANQGDIDTQTLAGAISTGTHGTGLGLGNLSSQVRSMTLLLASGELLALERGDSLFQAAALSLGSLGVIVDITIDLVPRYMLHEKNWALAVDDCCMSFERRSAESRNLEFFWLPGPDLCVVKCLAIAADETAPATEPEPPFAPPGTVERYLRPPRTAWSHLIYPSSRTVRFHEMEFAVPLHQGIACFLDIRELMQRQFPDVRWAVEYRTVKSDDLFLSQAYDRNVACISVHDAAEAKNEPLFRACQELFLRHQGRPHWGKIHYCDAPTLESMFPCWTNFLELRQALDPSGLFLNTYLRELLGAEA